MSENLSPVTAESSTDEDDLDSSKSKSKKKALGAFVVETEPPQKKESFWGKDEPKELFLGKKPSTEKVDESEASLTAAEKVAAVQQLAGARQAELASETVESDSPASDAEQAAAAAFLAAAKALGDTEAAYQQIAAELGEPLPDDAEESTAIDPPPTTETDPDQAAAEDEPQTPTPAATTPPAVSPPSPPRPIGGGSGSANTPPPPSSGSSGGTGGGSGGGGPYGGGPGPANPSGPTGPNTIPNPTPVSAEAVIPLSSARSNERRALADGLIVGGIVGYLYGRRRGRIKTEKRLAPVQRKLEKQVKSLETELLQTETTVRAQARKLQQEKPQVAALLTERWQRLPVTEVAKRPERAAGHVPVAPERIGHVLVAASATRSGFERLKTAAKEPKMEAPAAKKRAETMSRGELLAVSETVQVDGTSLRQIYETQLVSEKGLRRLVAEHLRGGNVARALRKELVEHQIDFERDPILRDRPTSDSSARASGAGRTALSSLLADAGVSDQAQTIPIGPLKKQLSTTATSKKALPKSPRQTIVDGALITLITVLVVAIILVIMRG